MLSGLHSAKYRPRHRYAYRRGRSRLTLSVAAATVASVGGISVGVAVAATPPAGVSSHGAANAVISGSRPSAAAEASGHAAPDTVAASPPVHPLSRPTPSRRDRRKGHRRHQSAAHRAATPGQPYLIYDSLTPAAIPGHHIIATYADGPHPVSPSEVAGRGQVLWIDINGTDPAAPILDVEPGCAAPSTAPGWAMRRLTAEPGAVAIIYTTISEWQAVRASVATLPAKMQSRLRWWIADPTGSPHIVPGSDATQWYWGPGYDISTATPRLQV